MKEIIKFNKISSSKKKIVFFFILILLLFNSFLPIILNSKIGSNDNVSNLLNLNSFNFNKNKIPIAPPTGSLNTLASDLGGNGNNRSVTAFFDSNGTQNGNNTHLIINTNGWDMLSPNLTIDQLNLYNFSKVLEDQASFSYDISTNLYLMSFNISQTSNLSEVDFLLRSQADNATILIYSSNSSIAPDTLLYKMNVSGFDGGLGSGTWINYTLTDKNLLNVTNTSNNTFFIGINRTISTAQWRGDNDGSNGGRVYRLSGSDWQEQTGVDLTLKIMLTPLDSTPLPTDINLQINGQNVLSNGTWRNSSRFNASGSVVNYNIDSSWENLTFRTNWTSVLIKNIEAIANFNANATQNLVYWNITFSNIEFGAIASNKQINVTLPASWNVSAVYNGTTTYSNTDNITENKIKILRIFDPPNSSWTINTNSINYINSIKLYKNSNEVSSALVYDQIQVNGTFVNNCYSGNSNLTIFLGTVEKNTTISSPNGNISIDVSLNDTYNILTNGTYKFRLTFNNGTEVGVNETYLDILNRTYINDISSDAQTTIFYSGQTLNITINFTMSYWNGVSFVRQPLDNLTGGNVTYKFYELSGNSWIPFNFNPTSEVWTTRFTLDIEIGTYTIYINASKDGCEYQNYSRVIQIIHFNGSVSGFGDSRQITIRGYENGTNLMGNGVSIQVPTHSNNLTFSNFTLYNISSINERIIENSDTRQFFNITDRTYAMKFNITDSSHITKVSFRLYIASALPRLMNLSVYLWNATWTTQIEPDKVIWQNFDQDYNLPRLESSYSVDLPNFLLDTSQTSNNSFFFSINGTPQNLQYIPKWTYTNDTVDNNDEGEAYNLTGGSWTLIDKDFWMNITLREYKNASQLALNISNIPVTDNPNLKYSGFWESSATYTASSDVVLSVQSNITTISYLINYTIQYENNSVESTTKFSFNVSDNVIMWNVTFLATLSDSSYNGTINVTYPKTWNVSEIYPPSKVNYTNTKIMNLGNIKFLIIKNITSAYNGTWSIIFYSNKLSSNIWIWNNTGGGYQQKNSVYIDDTIKFNASVSNINNGWANISIFNPVSSLYNIRTLSAPTQGSDYNFPDLRLMDNLTTDGNNTVLFLWSNGTEVAGKLAFLYIANASSLIVLSPQDPELQGNVIEGITGSTFNLTVYFNMSYWDSGWTSIPLNSSPSTSVTYKTNNLSIATPLTGNLTFIGNGTWTKIFNVPTVDAPYCVFINATSQNIEPCYLNFTLIVANRSNLELTPESQSVYWGENVTFSLNYTDRDNGNPIIGANISEVGYEIESISQSGQLIENVSYVVDSLNGIYNITIISETLSNYTYNLSFTINGYMYQPKTKYGILYVNNRSTSLTLPIAPIPVYLGDNVSFVLFYNDTINSSGITGAILKTNGSGVLDISWTPVAGEPGKYNVTLNSSNYNNIGNYKLELNASKNHYDIANLEVTIHVSWFYTNLTPISGVNGTINNWKINVTLNESHKIQVKYLNLWDDSPIEDALVDASFEGYLLSSLQIGDGNYSINLDTSVISNPDINKNYTLNITLRKNGYQTQSINITVNFLALNTILIPTENYINASHNDVISISVLLTNPTYQNIGPGFGEVNFYITNASGGIYHPGNLYYQSGYFRNDSVQLLSTELANGTYTIVVNFSSSYNFYLNSSCLITLNFSVATPIIPTVIEFINLPTAVFENSSLNILLNLTDSQKSQTIAGGLVEITIIASFEDGSTLTNITSTNTNSSGNVDMTYRVPIEAVSISISVSYYGSSQYEQSSNSTTVIVTRYEIYLDFYLLPFLFVFEGEPVYMTGLLKNELGNVPNGTVSITIFINVIPISFNITPSSDGTFLIVLPIPSGIFSVSASATYYGTHGLKVDAAHRSLAILNNWEYFFRENLGSFLIIMLIIALVIIGLVAYFKAIRPKTEPITEKKKRLMIQRAEMNQELFQITKEIEKMRTETLIQAQKAEKDGLFGEAAKAYEKVGNLSLELAEKSIAKDYFARSRELMKKVAKKELNEKRLEERKKLIELARNALREQKILEASQYYSKIVSISIKLGDLKTAEKFSNLIASTEDQMEMLKEQKLRNDLKGILSKGDKAMGKQKFSEAAKYFEEASRILLMLNEEEGVKKFAGWAKLARERQEIFSDTITDWTSELRSIIESTKKIVENKKSEGDYDQVILNLLKIAIYYLELDDEKNFKDYIKRSKSYSNKLKLFRTDTRAKFESEKLEMIKKAEKAESEEKLNTAAELYEKAAKLAIKIGDRYEGKELMNKAQILLKQAKKMSETEKLEKLEKETKPKKLPTISKLPKPKPITPMKEMIKPVAEITDIKKKPIIKPVKPVKIEIKPKKVAKLKVSPDVTVKEKPIKIDEKKVQELRKKIEQLHILIFDCQKSNRINTAIYYYNVAVQLAKEINDKHLVDSYILKIEELRAKTPKKIDPIKARAKIKKLLENAEKNLSKKAIPKVIENYKDIAEEFFKIGEEESGSDFLEKIKEYKK
ncbi:MAG: hypothetical protein ACTSRG_05875 [Candidatus Helarchaeota archaeon]